MLKLKNISFHYEDFVLDDITFTLEKGYVLGIAGANGAGKTTLMKILAKTLTPKQGTMSFDDKSEYRQTLAYLPSLFPFSSFTSVYRVLNFYDDVYETFDLAMASKKLKEFDIDSTMRIKQLSLGQKQKLMLALILCLKVDLILLDEPTEGIDFFIRKEIQQHLQSHLSQNKTTLIIATHQLDFYENLLDYVLYLENGQTLFYTDMIHFPLIAQDYLETKLENINLKEFAYQRQKEQTYD